MSRYPILAAFGLSLLLAACSSKRSRVHIVTTYSKVTETRSDSVDRFIFSAPGLYPMEHELDVEAAQFVLASEGKSLRFPRTAPGHYILNFGSDTLASMPLTYGTEWEQFMNASGSDHFGNARLDAKLDSAREARARKREAERAAAGKTGFQFLLPDSLKLVSRNADAKLYVFKEAPKQIEVERGEKVEYYQVQPYERMLKEVLLQMNEKPDTRELLRRAINSDQ